LEGFQDILLGMWQQLLSRVGGHNVVDWWQFMSAGLRQKLRGWSRNKGREGKLQKLAVLAQIKDLNEKADSIGIDEEDWAYRYHLEEQLLEIFRVEEEYWRQRGRIKWLLQGDANTAYFHAVANGRCQKCNILSLVAEGRSISDKRDIEEHIYGFYRNLLGASEPRSCRLSPDMWDSAPRVLPAEMRDCFLPSLSKS
jgi:mannosylglycoprotein endo-beta-mannosidase